MKRGNQDKQDYDGKEVSRQRNVTNISARNKIVRDRGGNFPTSAHMMAALTCLIKKATNQVKVGLNKDFFSSYLNWIIPILIFCAVLRPYSCILMSSDWYL